MISLIASGLDRVECDRQVAVDTSNPIQSARAKSPTPSDGTSRHKTPHLGRHASCGTESQLEAEMQEGKTNELVNSRCQPISVNVPRKTTKRL